MMDVKDIEDAEVYAKFLLAAIGIFSICVFIRSRVNRWRISNYLNESRLEKYNGIITFMKEFVIEYRQANKIHDVELRNITHKLTKDKCELISSVSSVMKQLASLMEDKTDAVSQNITVALDMEHLKNDQRFNKINRMIDALREEIKNLADAAKKSSNSADQHHRMRPDSGKISKHTDKGVMKKTSVNRCDAWVQTEYEVLLKKRIRDPNIIREHDTDPARSVLAVVKKSLAELTSEARNALTRGVEDEKSDVKRILSLLTEDRQDIKNEIIRAFTATAEQDQKNFAQFSRIGKEAMHYMTLLSENSNQALSTKLVDVKDTLKEVLTVLNRQMCHMASVVENLNESRKEFEDIMQKIETFCQSMNEMKGESKIEIENVVSKLNSKDKKLEDLISSLNQDTTEISIILNEIKSNKNLRNEKYLAEDLEPHGCFLGSVTKQVDSITLSTSNTMLKSFTEDLSTCCTKLSRMLKLIARSTNLVENIFKRLNERTNQADVMFDMITRKLHNTNDLLSEVAKDACKISNCMIEFDKENSQMEDMAGKIGKCADVIFSFVRNIDEVSIRYSNVMNEQKVTNVVDEKLDIEQSENKDTYKDDTGCEKIPSKDHKFMRNVIDQILREAYKVTMECHEKRCYTGCTTPETNLEGSISNLQENASAENLTQTFKHPFRVDEINTIQWVNLNDEPSVEEVSNISLVSNLTDSDN